MIAVAAALLLFSCGVVQREVEFTLEPDGVQVPATVGASDLLPVTVSVTVGGCRGFKRFEARRTANTLTLKVVGQETVGYGFGCPANIEYQTHTYTDPGTPSRSGPFEVVVNEKSWGKVEVR